MSDQHHARRRMLAEDFAASGYWLSRWLEERGHVPGDAEPSSEGQPHDGDVGTQAELEL